MITGYTYPFPGIVNQLVIDCAITLPNAVTGGVVQNIRALWDTGAQLTCISQRLVARLNLQPDGSTNILGANNQPFPAKVYSVQLIMGRFVIPYLRVAELPMQNTGHDVIIGMDVMSQGDLTITNYNGHTVLTFREPSLETVNYVEEIDLFNKCLKAHNVKVAHHIRQDKCECGSGKSFANCHGKSKYNKP